MVRFVNLSLFLLSTTAKATSSYNRYAGYLPTHQITDQASIDLDQEVFNAQLSNRNINAAYEIYVQGGHSGSYAVLTVRAGAHSGKTLVAGSAVTGVTNTGTAVQGTLRSNITISPNVADIAIEVIYNTGDNQANYVGCQVGGLTVVQQANLAGCKSFVVAPKLCVHQVLIS
jgi:hypothetical protein